YWRSVRRASCRRDRSWLNRLGSRMHLSAIRFGRYPSAPIHQWNLVRLGEYERSVGKLTRTTALYFQGRSSRQVLPVPEHFPAKACPGLDPGGDRFAARKRAELKSKT